jgi:hypothetical protein
LPRSGSLSVTVNTLAFHLRPGDEGFLRHNDPPNHLYTGEYGVDFEATLGIPEIDFGSDHFYPAHKQMNVLLEFARTWIDDHVAAGQRTNKPAILGEYGSESGTMA